MYLSIIKTKLVIVTFLSSLPLMSFAKALDVYGRVNVAVQYSDVDNKALNKINSNASRLGVKGHQDIDDTLSLFYQVEYGVNIDADSTNNFIARNQFVGLKTKFGSISAGRNDTVLKRSQGNIDQFNNLSADLRRLFKGDNRLAQTATYWSPNLNNFRIGATYIAESDAMQIRNPSTNNRDSGLSTVITYGDVELQKLPVYAAIAYDSKVNGNDIFRASIQAKIEHMTFGAIYQYQQDSYATNGIIQNKNNGLLFSGAYYVDNLIFKMQYQYIQGGIEKVLNGNIITTEAETYSFGVDYKLANTSKLYAFYTKYNYKFIPENDTYMGVGIEHKF